jgi:hypothetical protein
MTSIKPPSKTPTPGIEGPSGAGPSASPTGPSGPSFRERVGETAAVGKSSGAGAAEGPASTQSVVADLKAGAITPNEAVSRLTEAAMQRNRVPPTMRPAVEAQVRDFLQRDPVVGELLRTLGASVQSMDK